MGTNFKSNLTSKLAFLVLIAAWIVTASVVAAQSTKPPNLLLVQMLVRHGARAPHHKLYPTDPNPIEVWPQGLGMLTQLGKRQQYVLGKFLRYFYQGFVTSNPNEILVNSSEHDRCLQSALSNLAAFYAPTTEQWVVEDGLNWQPVVVHYREKTSDKYLSNADCTKFEKEKHKLYNSSDLLSELEKHNDLLEALKMHGGINITDFIDVVKFHDTVFTEKYHCLNVSEWIEPYWDELTALTDLTFHMMTNTTVLQRLRSGPILEKMLENMDNKIAGKDDHLKVYMYSTHDSNIAFLLNALGVYELPPPFSACLLVELHETLNRPAVRLLYLNSTTMQNISSISPVPLKLQGCDEFCPLEHFRQLVQPIIPEDWNKECQTTD
ncbi:hypothetical protein JTE90_006555 [Oedothorax gibbosus]|uniref:acid phosphatase n=1 Tax=Oedothorax gibbosus TaxID=931172 RepID=A0AAV6VJH9_9ARAC|nr:hypothetical protein JTE90_006555 [Oedothorax gibbosus]